MAIALWAIPAKNNKTTMKTIISSEETTTRKIWSAWCRRKASSLDQIEIKNIPNAIQIVVQKIKAEVFQLIINAPVETTAKPLMTKNNADATYCQSADGGGELANGLVNQAKIVSFAEVKAL